jgi:hypothetical protein
MLRLVHHGLALACALLLLFFALPVRLTPPGEAG